MDDGMRTLFLEESRLSISLLSSSSHISWPHSSVMVTCNLSSRQSLILPWPLPLSLKGFPADGQMDKYYGTGELRATLTNTLEDVEKTMQVFAEIEGIVGSFTDGFAGYKQTLEEIRTAVTKRLEDTQSDSKSNSPK